MNLIELSIINPPRCTVGNKVEKSQLAIFTDTLCATIYGLKEIASHMIIQDPISLNSCKELEFIMKREHRDAFISLNSME